MNAGADVGAVIGVVVVVGGGGGGGVSVVVVGGDVVIDAVRGITNCEFVIAAAVVVVVVEVVVVGGGGSAAAAVVVIVVEVVVVGGGGSGVVVVEGMFVGNITFSLTEMVLGRESPPLVVVVVCNTDISFKNFNKIKLNK